MPYGLRLPHFLCNRASSKNENKPNKKLSYPSLRSVLEYLEANKRIHITARCAEVRNIERSIPLHINFLELGESQITLNKVDYVLTKRATHLDSDGERIEPFLEVFDRHGVMTPGDILFKRQNETEEEVLANDFVVNDPLNPMNRIKITFQVGSEKIHHRALPESIEFHVAMKKLTTHLFGRRSDIRVRSLIIFVHTRILRLPMDLQFHVGELMTDFRCINSLQPILKEESIPLKVLGSYTICEKLNTPIVQTAKFLILPNTSLVTFLDLPNQKIDLTGTLFAEREIVEIVKHILNSGRSIDTCYRFLYNEPRAIPSLSEILELMKEQDVAGITESWEKSNDRNHKPHLQSISIPISSTSTLEISGRKFVGTSTRFIRMEVIPIVVVEPNQERVGTWFSKFLSNVFGTFAPMD